MDPKYWHDKWRVYDIGFNQESPHAQLLQYGSRLASPRVMVPLCGKSVDLLYLASLGLEVTGIELSPLACDSFFQENSIPVEKKAVGPVTLYQSEQISIWCGDFFAMPPETWEGCQSLYDRAAMVALPPELRAKYAERIQRNFFESALPGEKTMLLITVEYESGQVQGPPFSVPESEVRALYAGAARVEHLHTAIDSGLSHRSPKFSDTPVMESVYLLRR